MLPLWSIFPPVTWQEGRANAEWRGQRVSGWCWGLRITISQLHSNIYCLPGTKEKQSCDGQRCVSVIQMSLPRIRAVASFQRMTSFLPQGRAREETIWTRLLLFPNGSWRLSGTSLPQTLPLTTSKGWACDLEKQLELSTGAGARCSELPAVACNMIQEPPVPLHGLHGKVSRTTAVTESRNISRYVFVLRNCFEAGPDITEE